MTAAQILTEDWHGRYWRVERGRPWSIYSTPCAWPECLEPVAIRRDLIGRWRWHHLGSYWPPPSAPSTPHISSWSGRQRVCWQEAASDAVQAGVTSGRWP